MSSTVDKRLQRNFYVDESFKFNLAKYNRLLAHQDGGCAICGRKPTRIRLAVDHSHATGLLRGLLCFRCNRGYGLFHDEDPIRLRKAAEYLETPPFTKVFGEKYTAPGRIGTKKRAKMLEQMKNGRFQQNKNEKKERRS